LLPRSPIFSTAGSAADEVSRELLTRGVRYVDEHRADWDLDELIRLAGVEPPA
jgi:hypothetical protein